MKLLRIDRAAFESAAIFPVVLGSKLLFYKPGTPA